MGLIHASGQPYRQTDRHTDTLITILRTHAGDGVNIVYTYLSLLGENLAHRPDVGRPIKRMHIIHDVNLNLVMLLH